MLTASWGGIGILWERKVAMCVIRPHRYTFEFMERHPAFSLSFFDEKYRKALKLCGKVSGRDIDKVKAAGLTPIEGRKGGIYFDEARMVLECRKIYWHDFDPTHFIEPKLDVFYPDKDYHRLYIGEIVNCLVH
jgi:flavin reductase (DIM6/NTAB) family NADH-FMN oxidoreductase RutF